MVIPELTTTRLLLTAWREADLDEFAAMCADPDVMRYLGHGRALDRVEAWRVLALIVGHWELRGYGQWAVRLRADGSFVGRAGLWQPEGWPGLEVGWALARSRWGQGFATEAGRAAIEHAWDSLEATEIVSVIHPDNTASQRVAQRLGLHLDRRETLGDKEVLLYCRRRH